MPLAASIPFVRHAMIRGHGRSGSGSGASQLLGKGRKGVSQHLADRLIRALIQAGRPATQEEIGRIIEHTATVAFDPRVVPVATKHRGTAYAGELLCARAPSLTYHLIKRVVLDQQWAPGTTATDYLADLRRAVRHPQARLMAHHRRGGAIATTITPTAAVVPLARRGMNAAPLLFVAYSADRGALLSGYQVMRLEDLSIPEDGLWLR